MKLRINVHVACVAPDGTTRWVETVPFDCEANPDFAREFGCLLTLVIDTSFEGVPDGGWVSRCCTDACG